MTDFHTWLLIAVMAVVTAALRFLPFLVFNSSHKMPKLLEKLGRVLPYAIMGMLVVYCLKDVTFTDISGFLPELIACTLTGALYIWRKNTLLSILCGTVCNMLLVQLVF